MIFNGRKIKDITGARSGKLIAVRPVNPLERYGNSERKEILWECQCDCGEKSIQRASVITRGERKSCGCMRSCGREGIVRGYKTRSDRAAASAKCGDVPLWYFRHTESGARSRGLQVGVSIEYVSDLYRRQQGKCLLSGRDLMFGCGKDAAKTTASLDRIDSSLGYVEGNVQWIHKRLNMLKKRMGDERFIEWCVASWEIMRDVAVKSGR